ncbi:MAG: DUF2254 domain-containing protein, partial [Planctomycetes bacterium]|nr:DUF2254 domain-containing protein [Planctomycetota bacterium]
MRTTPRPQLSLVAIFLVTVFAGAWFSFLALWEDGRLGIDISSDPKDFSVIASTLARTSVTLISTVFACLFLAIPLTANMFTPQIIENFWRAKTNRLVLGLYVFSAGNAIWLSSLASTEPRRVHIYVSYVLVIITLIVLLPYLFSIFRLIDPNSIVRRVAWNVRQAMRAPVRSQIAVRQEALAR